MGELKSNPGEVPFRAATLALGDLTIALNAGVVEELRWCDVELLRGITYPIRDADWGTVATNSDGETLSSDGQSATYTRNFSSPAGFDGRLTLEANAAGHVTLDLEMIARCRQMICRAGFTLLHPIRSLAGRALSVVHDDGSVEETTFPELISPSQPARDIAGLRYEIDGCSITIDMLGDVFEMEDQRNWSDASYKTYCRPLARPCPYQVAAEERIHQRLEISLRGRKPASVRMPARSATSRICGEPLPEELPSVALATEAGWDYSLPGGLDGLPRIVRVDLRREAAALRHFTTAPFDLELITADTLDAARVQLETFASALSTAKVAPEHVIALPGAYLNSHQPDGTWPAGATPPDIVAAARAAFPNVKIGGGMLTNFTELNRCRPDPAMLDYISHGTSAIVHAADDASIFQTIEALPQIFASVQSIAPGVPYRLGLVSIGMRTNPYGAGLADNREGLPRTMTANDPRCGTLVGAAWMVAAMAATLGFAIDAIALGSPTGPFGIIDIQTGRLRPAYHIIRGLHAMRGLPRAKIETGDPTVHVVASFAGNAVQAIAANGSGVERSLRLPGPAVGLVLDQTTVADAATDSTWIDRTAPLPSELRLSPYAVAFMSFPRSSRQAR